MDGDFGTLAERHGRQVFLAAYRVLGDAHAAEEVQQDVFLKVIAKRPRDVASWPAYLVGAAARLAIDRLRARRRWRRLLAPFAFDARERRDASFDDALREPAPAAYDDSALGSAIDRERAAQLRAAIAALPAREAHCFTLRYVEGLDIAELAAVLGLTPNHVGVLLHRATAKLKAHVNLAGEPA